MEYIDVTPIREAVEKALANGYTLSEICRRMGWEENRVFAETSRLRRVIGAENKDKTISVKNAELIADALNLSYNEIGL